LAPNDVITAVTVTDPDVVAECSDHFPVTVAMDLARL